MSLKSVFRKLGLPRIRGYVDAAYRSQIVIREELERLKRLPRYEPTATNILGRVIEMPDAGSFLEMYDEVFSRQMFSFSCPHDSPRIIDGGANIGLFTLYFKRLFPNSSITAFEPDPAIFNYLKRNIRTWGCTDVELQRCALAARETTLPFMAEGSYAGRLARPDDDHHGAVRCMRLRPWLEQPIDLLKLNIEGPETEVLVDCADLLGNVSNIVVEYHSFAGERQTLPELLKVLRGSGFRLHVNPVRGPLAQPFLESDVLLGMDLQLAVFASRTT
jgi:FkbM family methyltransferase